MKKLRVAVIGCGKMGIKHVRAVALQEGAELVAVSDPLAETGPLMKILPPGTRIFRDTERMIRDCRPEIVHICTPPSSHASLARMALESGIHVLVEKPFAMKKEDAVALAGLAAEKDLKICAGHQLLFEKPAIDAEKALHLIGRIVHVESHFSFRPVRKSAGSSRPMTPEEQLLDILPHPVYTLLRFLGGGGGGTGEGPEIRAVTVRPEGDVHAILERGNATGILVVTLNGRPVESYLKIVGTNGSLLADFVHGSLVKLPGPGSSAVSIVLSPYSSARQTFTGAVHGLAELINTRRKGVYPGLTELVMSFYRWIAGEGPPPMTPASIVETVSVCDAVGERLLSAVADREASVADALLEEERSLPPLRDARNTILLSGGTGFLGKAVAVKLRMAGWRVRVPTRRSPPSSARVPGVEYVEADLGAEVPPALLSGVRAVVHGAAETAGNKEAHVRNTVDLTRNLLEASQAAGVEMFIHISSLAVLKTGKDIKGPIDEETPLDAGNEGRGPYVWGKAEAERIVRAFPQTPGFRTAVIRLGPLVDFSAFEPPGRLGREVGRRFVCMGSYGSRMAVCDVYTAARVIRYYLEDFGNAPPVLNLVEPDPPTRRDLVKRFLAVRPDLKPLVVPTFAVSLASPLLKVLQRLILRGRKPIDIRSAFASEQYRTALAETIISRAG
ncbi:MAG: NAD-dependent epimerase/dehydratase family protein [Deltaproteobacteria bacterium]|nr:MAG: NAD-dependent epimerase/dehydratase family protein [Deltaproteobacteria bacterium]